VTQNYELEIHPGDQNKKYRSAGRDNDIGAWPTKGPEY
jgi:hypothetical protein